MAASRKIAGKRRFEKTNPICTKSPSDNVFRHSREGGNPEPHAARLDSRVRGNDRIQVKDLPVLPGWIPAFAGMTGDSAVFA